MNRYIAASAALIAGLFCVSGAHAQLAVAKVVASCGTVSPTPHVGSTYAFTMDTTGTLCTEGGGGGGGGTSSAFGATFPANGTAAGFEYLSSPPTLTSGQMVAGQTDVNGRLLTNGGVIQAVNSVAINVSTATTTQLVALSGTTKIYVTSFDVVAGGTGNITFEYGTGGSCASGATPLTGAYNLTAQNGIAKGNGLGPVLVVPAGNALCVLTSAGVQMSGSVSYLQQ